MLRAFLMALALPGLFVTGMGTAKAHDSNAQSVTERSAEILLRRDIETRGDLETIVTRIALPPHSTLPAHTHPGEEIVYVLEGEAIHWQEGQPERLYRAGESFVIPKGAVHRPITKDKPVRALVVRLHVKGEPERTLAE